MWIALLLCAEAVAQTPAVRLVLDHPGMPQNFLSCDRNQPLLLPPDVRDWLPEDHLAWFVIEAIEAARPWALLRPPTAKTATAAPPTSRR